MEYDNNEGWHREPYNSYDQQNQQYGGQSRSPYRKQNGFAMASCILGIVAILSVFTMTIFPALIFGGLALILGLLSRGSAKKPAGQALVGVITGAGALVFDIAICFGSFYLYFNNAELRREVNEMVDETYQQFFGMGLEEILENYGIDPDSLE